jgi:isocitrate/isopropylmalate dehydrogenase
MTSKPTYRIASIPGDGIGTEVVAAAIQVVEKLAKTLDTFQIEFTHIPWGTAYYKQHGRYLPEDGLDTLRQFDAGLFGAVGAPGMYDMREVGFCNPKINISHGVQTYRITSLSGVSSSPSAAHYSSTPTFVRCGHSRELNAR